MLPISIIIGTIVIVIISFLLLGDYLKEEKKEKTRISIIKKIKNLDWSSITWEVTTEENEKIIVTKMIIPKEIYDQVKKIFNSYSYKISQYVYIGHAYYDAGVRNQLTEYSEFFDKTGSLILLSKTKKEKEKNFLKVNLNIELEQHHIKNVNKEFII
jgi:hypothetical protein